MTDVLLWAVAALVLLHALENGRPRHWVMPGIVPGLGLLNKIRVLWPGGGIFLALPLAPHRRVLRQPWPRGRAKVDSREAWPRPRLYVQGVWAEGAAEQADAADGLRRHGSCGATAALPRPQLITGAFARSRTVAWEVEMVSKVFPEPITDLPEADIPLKGVKGYLSQSMGHQIVFMEFSEDVEVPAHSHESQWGIVLEGRVDLIIGGVERTCAKGDRYFIPKGVEHSAHVHAGYADATFFDQEDRYGQK